MAGIARSAARIAVAAAVVAGASAVGVGAAYAADATVVFHGGEMTYTAAPGQVNRLVLSRVSTTPEVYAFDDVVPISSAEPDCVHPVPADLTLLYCTHPSTFAVEVNGGDLDDYLESAQPTLARLSGQDGNDTIRTATGAGSDGEVDGGPGDDLIYSGTGNDWISGGLGTDTVSYRGRFGAVTASLAGGLGGATGETDHYFGVENLGGGGGADTLTGDSGVNVLDGGTARTPCLPYPLTTLVAAGVPMAAPAPAPCTSYSGADLLIGNGGNDVLYGRAADDTLLGGTGKDTLYGGSGFDQLDGGGIEIDYCYTDADGGTVTSCDGGIW